MLNKWEQQSGNNHKISEQPLMFNISTVKTWITEDLGFKNSTYMVHLILERKICLLSLGLEFYKLSTDMWWCRINDRVSESQFKASFAGWNLGVTPSDPNSHSKRLHGVHHKEEETLVKQNYLKNTFIMVDNWNYIRQLAASLKIKKIIIN